MGSVRKSPRNPTRWEARYRDASGRQRTKTFPSRTDAKAWLAATETDLRRGSWIDPKMSAIRLEEVADHWLEAPQSKHPVPSPVIAASSTTTSSRCSAPARSAR